MRIYNTLSGKKEPLSRLRNHPLRLFVCGPTVYDHLHIGNARTYLVFDSFVKYLRSQGVKIDYLQNITDIDDKIIIRAKEEKTAPNAIAKKYTYIYRKNMKALGITAVDTYAAATKFIPQIVRQVQTLLSKGYAYTIPHDGVYFDIKKFKDYGKLSRRTALQAEDGTSRIDESVKKRNKGDFCLWKFSKPGEPIWETSLGAGRPGWHIEDTAISEHYFGSQYDIHGAGVDLKFPHHEAEIAQQESASGKKPFVKIWMHVGSLLVHGKKMSKSSGNYISIDDFLKQYPPEALRLLALSHHYRSPIDYTPFPEATPPLELGDMNAQSWNGILRDLAKILFIATKSKITKRLHSVIRKKLKEIQVCFSDALQDDFNTAEALAQIYILEGMVIHRIDLDLHPSEAKEYFQWIKSSLEFLGFRVRFPKIPSKISALVQKREKSRTNKQFVQSDALRKKIEGLGYIVEDTPLGPFIWLKNSN